MQAEFTYRPQVWTFFGASVALIGVGIVFLSAGSDALSPETSRMLGYSLIGIWLLGAPFSLHPLLLGPGRIEIGPESMTFPRTMRRKPGTLQFKATEDLKVEAGHKDKLILYPEGEKKVEFKKHWFKSEKRWHEFRELLLERLDLDQF